MSEFAVEATDIVRTFNDGDFRALDGVSLRVPTGQVFGLLGPNGSGKTTMVRILSTVLAPTEGRAIVGGFDVVKQPGHVRRVIGLAGQFAAVDENLTGFENLRMVGFLNHMEKSTAVTRSRELARRFRFGRVRQQTGLDLLRRHAAPSRPRGCAGGRSADPLPGRTDDRPRSPEPSGPLGDHRGTRRRGHDDPLDDPVPRRGRPACKQLVVLDHGKIIAEGTSSQLKSSLGNTVLVLTFATTGDSQHALDLIADLSSKPANVDGTVIELTVDKGPATALRHFVASTPRPSKSLVSNCESRASTTSSSTHRP